MRYFDAHNHLHSSTAKTEWDSAMFAAAGAGIAGMLCCGTRPSDWEDVLTLSGKYKSVIPCL